MVILSAVHGIEVRLLIGSFRTLQIRHFDILKNVFYRDQLLMLCLSLQISFQRNVEWKYRHVIDIMPASENGLCLLCWNSGLFWRLQLLSIVAVGGKINIGGQLYAIWLHRNHIVTRIKRPDQKKALKLGYYFIQLLCSLWLVNLVRAIFFCMCVPLKSRAFLIQWPKYLVVYHQVCLTAMTNKSLELTQISQEDWWTCHQDY